MAKLNYLQTVNAVLRRLRQDTVQSYNERSYSTLIGDFVNQARREVENAHYWTDLRKLTTLSLTASTQTYSLSSWADRGRLDSVVDETNSRARIKVVSDRYFESLFPSDQEATPQYCRLYLSDSNGDPRIQFYPTPDAAITCSVYGYVGQSDITADATAITVPSHPVILRAYAFAIQERGEDAGLSYAEAADAAERALFEAIERDDESRYNGQAPAWSVG